MHKFAGAVAAAIALTLARGAGAADPKSAESLATSNGCLACHTVDKKLVGPGFREIAAKYRNNKAAAADLAQKVKAGSKGIWGDIPMPPNTHLKDGDIKTIVAWMLTLQ